MQHIPLLVLFVLLYGFTSALPVSAKIYINEFYSAETEDWIEIYNDSDEEVSLNGYQLKDSTESHKKDLEGFVGGQGFSVVEWNWLNVEEDKIRLINENNIVDEISYGTDSLPAPEKGQSVGRSEDGLVSWSIFSSHSKGSSNSESEIYTIPEPTATLTPTFTKTPTPSKTPSPKKPSTFTKTPIPSNTPVSPVINDDSDVSILPISNDVEATESAVLGQDAVGGISPSAHKTSPTVFKEAVQTLGSKYSNKGGFAVIAAGVLLLSSCGILVLRKYRYLIFR